MELTELLDQLTMELAKHTQMLKDKQFNNEYEKCKKSIAEINKTIRLRIIESGKNEDYLPGTDPDYISPNSDLPTPNSRLPTPDSQLPTPDSQLPTHFPLYLLKG
jgi:hypothetical protein